MGKPDIPSTPVKASHTPTPWDCWDMDETGWHIFADKFGTRSVGQDCRRSIAQVRSGQSWIDKASNYREGVANAHFIVEAVNNHDRLRAENDRLRKALEKVRSYNVDIAAERINYRPHDHIQVIDNALFAQ